MWSLSLVGGEQVSTPDLHVLECNADFVHDSFRQELLWG